MAYSTAHTAPAEQILNVLNTPVQEALNNGIAPAIALSVYWQGSPLVSAGWGWIDPDDRQHPVTGTAYFDLASLTKLYTTVCVLTLISRGKLHLHTRVVQVVPEFGERSPRAIGGGQNPHTKEPEDVDALFAGKTVNPADITVRHLLTHTSGLPAWRDVYNIASRPVPPDETDPLTASERWQRALKQICTYEFVAPPETGVRYSDIGLMLLGEVVARVAGSSLSEAIAEYADDTAVFHPLQQGIPRTDIPPTEYDVTWRERRVWGEVHDENACGAGGVAAHAGLFAPADAVATFGNRWLTGDFDIDPELRAAATELQAKTGAHMHGFGWMMKSPQNSSAGDVFSSDSYGHTGFTGTSLWIDPQRELVVALLTNRVYPGRDKPGIHALRRAVHDAIASEVDK